MMTEQRKLFTAYSTLLAAAIFWNLAIVGAPWAWAGGHTSLASVLYFVFSPICHQHPERSFYLFGHHLAVCNRCTGIYSGALLGLMLFPFLGKTLRAGSNRAAKVRTPRRYLLVAALGLMAADVGLELLRIRLTTPGSRFLTGLFCGIVAPFYLLPSFFELFLPNPKKNTLPSMTNLPAAGRS